MRHLLASANAIVALCCVALGSGCSCSDTGDDAAGPPAGSGGFPEGGADGSPGDGAIDVGIDQIGPQDGSGCTTGAACGDGGICVGGSCCEADKACGEVCCGAVEVCSFQKCVTPGDICVDSTDCAEDEYCEYALGEPVDAGPPDGGCTGGAATLEGRCLPRPPQCSEVDGGVPDAGALTCLESCEVVPPVTDFQAEVKYAWGGDTAPPYSSDIMMSPIVIQLDDDDCDGKITANDIPEMVFNTFASGAYTAIGTLHAISIVGGAVVEKWTVPGIARAASELAGGNIDGLPGNEVVVCGDAAVHALDGQGNVVWSNTDGLACRTPLIADLDGDGTAEVVVEGGILDGVTGQTEHAFAAGGQSVASDIDGDGELDVVTARRAYHADGTQFVDTGADGSWPAVGDFDRDGVPEVVAVDSATHRMWLWRYDAASADGYAIVRDPIDINGTLDPSLCPVGSAGNTRGGGPPTVADFNGDGIPDIALAGGVGYAIFDGAKLMDPSVAGGDTFLWVKQTHDCSSAATGSSIFDFNGDGRAEVVYSDEYMFRIYEGATGNVLWETCNTTGTLIEYPLVADVDNDGQADIVVVSNAYAFSCNGTKQSGLRVFGSANGTWVRTRRVWNQHSYHVTNIEEDGTIPVHEKENWTQPGLNNFRQNKQPGSEFAAPDAVVTVAIRCSPLGIVATVRNLGEASIPAGIVVTFLEGSPPSGTVLGTGVTTKTLYSAQSEVVTLAITSAMPGIANGTTPVYATVAPPAGVTECRADNNASTPVAASCGVPK